MIGIIILTSIGLIMGIVLVQADYKMDKTSNFVDKLITYLPGFNCGSCGYGGCPGMADAINKDVMSYNKCRPLKGEQKKKLEEFLKKHKKM